ncbi:MAG: hypothetical protein COA49_06340 [Bacteroidetes bacterium]|nr:MAG: hypothetical protein COA49_06340 [Bacteroidota bacterium]
MKKVIYIFWSLLMISSLCISEYSGQTNLDLKQHLINGVSYFEAQNPQDAVTSFSNGSTLEGFEDIAAYNMGRALMETEDLEGATSAFKHAIDSSDDPKLKSKSWYNSGNIALNSQDPSTAIEDYKSALRLDPSNSDARYNLALANAMLQQQQEQEQQSDQEQEQQDQEQDQEQDGENSDQDQEQEQDQDQDGENDNQDQDSENDDQDQEQDQEQDGENDNQDQDQEQDQDGENDDQQNKDSGKENPEEKDDMGGNKDQTHGGQDENGEEQQIAGRISMEEMARILESLENEESKIQSKLRKTKGDGKKKTIEKEW